MRPLIVCAALSTLLTGCVGPAAPVELPTPRVIAEPCAFDANDTAATAEALIDAVPGFICPERDQDWFVVNVPPNAPLLRVELSLDGPVSPLALTWSVFADDGTTSLAGPAADEEATAAESLSVIHRLDPGSHRLVVRDIGDDAADPRHGYALAVEALADPDPAEPNDDEATATPESPTTTGWIASRGDEDWYAIDVPDRSVLEARLTMPLTSLQPRMRIIDPQGVRIVATTNEAGQLDPTDLELAPGIGLGGLFHVVISDSQGRAADPNTPYELTLHVRADLDPNEPNDHPSAATPVQELTCGSAWTTPVRFDGALSSAGDIDWFRVPLSDCAPGLVEATVEMLDPAGLPDDLQPELRLLREVEGSSCVLDQECVALEETCSDALDCSGIGNLCVGSRCAGAGVCLPSGVCGTNTLVEVAEGLDPDVTLSAPLQGLDAVWVGVADQQGDAWSASAGYTLRMRVREEPDSNEPSELYTGGPPTGNATARHSAFAVELPVHDCVVPDGADPLFEPDCCDSTTWVDGRISYAYDQDWFSYDHPCPGEDCMLRVHFSIDGGPVDHYVRLFRGNSLWFDTLTGQDEQILQPQMDTSYGGLDSADACFYAYQGHSGNPYRYYLAVRDTTWVSSSEPTGGTWDWAPDQRYSLCVEKVAAGCQDPCVEYSDGCGQP